MRCGNETHLEEVVHVFGHLDVQSGIYVCKDNVVQAPSQRQRLWGIHALHHLDGLPYLSRVEGVGFRV